MAESFTDLSRALNGMADDVVKDTEAGVRRTARAAVRTAVRRTPVKSGFARSGWIVTLTKETFRTRTRPFVPLVRGDISEQGNANAAIAIADRVIQRFKFTRGRAPTIFIQNNVEYIQDLDNGSSRQAPTGFSDMAVTSAVSEANKIRIRRL